MKFFALIVLAVCCLPFFGVGVYEAYRNVSESREFLHTEGTIIGNAYTTVRDENGNTSGSYLPEVEFFSLTGEKIRFTDKVGSLPPDYEKGDQVEVIYPSANPREARIDSWKRIWLVPSIFMAVGAIPFVIGVILLRRLV